MVSEGSSKANRWSMNWDSSSMPLKRPSFVSPERSPFPVPLTTGSDDGISSRPQADDERDNVSCDVASYDTDIESSSDVDVGVWEATTQASFCA